jgi:integrase
MTYSHLSSGYSFHHNLRPAKITNTPPTLFGGHEHVHRAIENPLIESFLKRMGQNGLGHLTLTKMGTSYNISMKNTRASFITNALDQNERMSYVQKQVGHTTTRMIVDHYYRYVPAPDDGAKLENAWNSTRGWWVGFISN